MNFQNIMDQEWSKFKKTGISKINFPDIPIKIKPEIITKEEFEIHKYMYNKYKNRENNNIKFPTIEIKKVVEKDLEELKIWNELKEKGINVEWAKKAAEVGVDIVN